jgi:hypothetical protein
MSEEKVNVTLKVLPVEGLVSIQNFADFLGTNPSDLQQRLTDNGIHTLALSSRFTQRFVSLGDVVKQIGKGKYEAKVEGVS